MTLVALLALTAQAWADEVTVTFTQDDLNGNGTVTKDGVTLTPGNNMAHANENLYNYGSTTFSVDKGTFTKIEIVNCYYGEIGGWQREQTGSYQPYPEDPDYWQDLYTLTWTGEAESVAFTADVLGIQSIVFTIAAPTAPTFPINWNATAKTASIAAMPAGNVTVKVNYYPQATADGAVTAATGAIVSTDAPLVTIDANKLTGADGMMYYVSETSTAPDYTAKGWTTAVPNAKNYTEAKTLYLWYYPLGRVGQTADDIYSDGNMNDEPLELSVAPVPTYDIAIGAGNFATFYDLVNVMLDPQAPEGVGLYTITSIDDQRTKATLAPLTGIVPGGTPMIIYNGTGNKQSVKLKATTDEASDNNPKFIDQFVGASTDVWFDENAMAENDFYLLSGGKAFAPVLGPGRLKANQCYLIFSKQPGARTIQLVFEDATGITTVSGSPADAPLYDLNGRRVTKPAKKGVYIQNGRKVVR